MDNLFDLHIYTNNSKGGNDKVSFLCETAVAKGLRAVAFTDVCTVGAENNYDNQRRLRHSYFDTAKARQVFFDSLMVLSGVEFDRALTNPSFADKVLTTQNYDIVLSCLTHFEGMNDFGLRYNGTGEEFNNFVALYTEELQKTVLTTDFDVLSKPLAPLRNLNNNFTLFREYMKPVLALAAQKEKALEVTTKDLLGSDTVRNLYGEILTDFKNAGGKYITLGSESYFHDEIGSGLDIAIAAVKRSGFTEITLFERRIPYLFNI